MPPNQHSLKLIELLAGLNAQAAALGSSLALGDEQALEVMAQASQTLRQSAMELMQLTQRQKLSPIERAELQSQLMNISTLLATQRTALMRRMAFVERAVQTLMPQQARGTTYQPGASAAYSGRAQSGRLGKTSA
jgi:hypothetical protein